MLDLLGTRQRNLLRLLLKNKEGMTVDELAQALDISHNAVRQHLAALISEDLVMSGPTRPSGGRPEQLYVLSDKGREMFPRQYAWLAQLVLESLRQESGKQGLQDRLKVMGERIGEQLREQNPGLATRRDKVQRLSQLMEQLGYSTGGEATTANTPTIEAGNCVFHELALKDPHVCQFDLALMSSFTGSEVEHQACMAKGDKVCRFKFKQQGH